MNTDDYITKIMDHLNHEATYQKLDHNPSTDIAKDIEHYAKHLENQYIIDETTRRFLTPSIPPRTSLFYGLPKVHKPGIPLRPIVSGCDSATDPLSRYLTHFLQPLAEKLPSHIKDTKHFLRELNALPSLPEGALLVTADVTSLYTNIPHDEGINATIHYVNMYRESMPSYTPPTNVFRTMLRLILGNSIFQFMEETYKQISGTSMGTRVAPPYANLFMGLIEDLITGNFSLIHFWKRFIDDIFFIFLGTETQLEEVIRFMNNMHPTIKFTFQYSHHQIAFLDTMVYIDDQRKLQTTIYRKPTDKMCLLHFNSNHPLHMKESIIYSQAIRYCTIISDDRNLDLELQTLAKTLLARNYPLEMIQKNFSKALSHTRETLLIYRPDEESPEVTPLITPFTPVGSLVSRIVNQHWHIIEEDAHLHRIWPNRTTTAFNRSNNIKDILVHSKQQV